MNDVNIPQLANALHAEMKGVCTTIESLGEGDETGIA